MTKEGPIVTGMAEGLGSVYLCTNPYCAHEIEVIYEKEPEDDSSP